MRLIVDKNILVPMRDSVLLCTDVYRPSTNNSQYPAILQRTPYNKEQPSLLGGWLDVFHAVQRGFVVVVQDTRGRYRSEGRFEPFQDEASDGEDTIEWIAAQNWSSGAVGMAGASYLGATQWLAATKQPTALRAISPSTTTDQYFDGWTYQGGALQLGFILTWTLASLGFGEAVRRAPADSASVTELIDLVDKIDELLVATPIKSVAELPGFAGYYGMWLSRQSYDHYWQALSPKEEYSKIIVPALNIGGWYDIFLRGTLRNYMGMRRYGGSDLARRGQRLIVGPWSHGSTGGLFPERSFGVRGSVGGADVTGTQLRWFRQTLTDEGLDFDEPPVSIFVMGPNRWRTEMDWPLPDTRYIDYFLSSSGASNTQHGDGRLGTEAPSLSDQDVFYYDPRDPVPTVGGATFLPGLLIAANAGPRDQRAVELRQDVLCYTSDPLEDDTEVTGPIELILYASSSAVDTDFTGKLVNVFPDGRAEIVSDGILRSRYRVSPVRPELITPGVVYEFRLDLGATSCVFPAGHRFRLEVSSSNFPRFARNMNTGGDNISENIDSAVVAVNRIYHSSQFPSRLILPIISRS